MSTSRLHTALTDLQDPATPSSFVATTVAPAAADIHAVAEVRMRRGKRLVIGGFAVTVVGIIAYCLACFYASQYLATGSLERAWWFVAPSLGVLGLGTLLWLVGSFLFLSGAMDSDPEGPDLYF
jgi:hypothetical protein